MKKLDYREPKCKMVRFQSSRRFMEVSPNYGEAGYAGNYDSSKDIDYDNLDITF